MKAGDMVRFDVEPYLPAYGIVINIEGDVAVVDFQNPLGGNYEIKRVPLVELKLIGNKIR